MSTGEEDVYLRPCIIKSCGEVVLCGELETAPLCPRHDHDHELQNQDEE